jgi:hypothetical protein
VKDDAAHRRLRLAEAIAWCSLQKLQNNPPESDEIKRRRALGERAKNHAFAAHQLEAASPFKWVTRGKVKCMKEEASRMYAEAKRDESQPLAHHLRTPDLRPLPPISDLQANSSRAETVERLSEERAMRLKEMGQRPNPCGSVASLGRFLFYCPAENLSDGAAACLSKDFFDDENAPPWDTWVSFHDKHLVSFVPRPLGALAQLGIEVNSEESIGWTDEAFVAKVFGPLAG